MITANSSAQAADSQDAFPAAVASRRTRMHGPSLAPLGTDRMPQHALTIGPVAMPLLRLALPILVVLAVQTLVSVAETYFIGFLGSAAVPISSDWWLCDDVPSCDCPGVRSGAKLA